jgi:hypothetical protein
MSTSLLQSLAGKIEDAVMQVRTLVEHSPGSPPPKDSKTSSESAAGKRGAEKNTVVSKEILASSMQKVAYVLAEELNDQVVRLDEKIDNVNVGTELKLRAEITTVKQELVDSFNGEINSLKTENRKLQAVCEQLTKQVNDTSAAITTIPHGAPASSTTNIPVNQRTTGCLGNLGWDTPGEGLLVRAEQLLAEVEIIKSTHYTDIRLATRLKTSFVLVDFTDPSHIATFGRKIDRLGRSMIAAEPDKKVYLTIAKTYEERAPTRKLRKLAKYLESIEQGYEVAARLGVQAVPFERIVKVGINVAA